MNLARIILIVVAIAIAGVTAYLVKTFIDRRDEDIAKTKGGGVVSTEVLVAERSIASGTIISAEMLAWRQWPAAKIHKNFVVKKQGVSLKKYVGQAMLKETDAGEPILKSRLLVPGSKPFLAAVIRPGYRAFTVRLNSLSSTGGFVSPGSLVDILWTYSFRDPVTRRRSPVSETIMKKVRVLALDARLATSKTPNARSKTATLEVKPSDAEKLSVAVRMGRLTLMVRSTRNEPDIERLAPFTTPSSFSQFQQASSGGGVPWALMATRDLKQGILLKDLDFEWRPMPPNSNVDSLIVMGDFPAAGDFAVNNPINGLAIRGAYLTRDIKNGQPFPRRAIILPSEQGFISRVLKPGMRAISIPASQLSAVSGYISPGDRVDIYWQHVVIDKSERPLLNPRRFSEVILRNVRILGSIQIINPFISRPAQMGAITVEVSPKDAGRLNIAISTGKITLAARSMYDTDDRPLITTDLDVGRSLVDFLLTGTATNPVLRRRQLDLLTQQTFSKSPEDTARIYRGGSRSTVKIVE